MFLAPIQIDETSLVRDLVEKDYRTADVFRKHGIGYCCGGKWPISIACKMQGVDISTLKEELQIATRRSHLSETMNFDDCSTDFIIDYIMNVHHKFIKKNLRSIKDQVVEFVQEHNRKYSYLDDLSQRLANLESAIISSMKFEEEHFFPYVRRLTHACKYKESYGALLVKLLKIPFQNGLMDVHEEVSSIILSIRSLLMNYAPPEKACINHKVVLAKLSELDNNLMHQLYLEQEILIPRIAEMESTIQSA